MIGSPSVRDEYEVPGFQMFCFGKYRKKENSAETYTQLTLSRTELKADFLFSFEVSKKRGYGNITSLYSNIMIFYLNLEPLVAKKTR